MEQNVNLEQNENIQSHDNNELISALAGYDVVENIDDKKDVPINDNIDIKRIQEITDKLDYYDKYNLYDDEKDLKEKPDVYSDIYVNLHDLPEDLQDYYLASKDEKFNPETYKNQQQKYNELKNKSPKEFYKEYLIANHLKSEYNPDGVLETIEDVQKELDRLSPLELKTKSDDLKLKLKEYVDSQKKERLKKIGQPAPFDHVEYSKEIEKVIDKNKDINSFFGFQFDKVEKKEIDEAFREYTRINQETGKALIHDILEDDDLLYKVVAIMHKKEALQGKMFDKVEAVKQKIIDKLGIEPSSGLGGGTASGGAPEFNPNVLI